MSRTCDYNRSNRNSNKSELLKYSGFILHNRIEKGKVLFFGFILFRSFAVSSIYSRLLFTFLTIFDHLTFVIILDHLTYNPKFFGVWFPRFHWLNRSDDYDPTDVASLIRLRLSRCAPHPGPPAICSGLVRVDANFALFVGGTFRRRHHSSEAPFNDVFEFKSRMNFQRTSSSKLWTAI